jgi:dGTPase
VLTIREQIETREEAQLAPAATNSRGVQRLIPEEPCAIRTEFQRDRDRIIHCRAFRRLQAKTQVFLSPAGDHVRTRLTHTLEVTQIARTIARALRLNEDLTEAIGLGHDLGHTPFGHVGERALAERFPAFRHNEQSLRVVDCLEKDGHGLNLTQPTRDGILRHSKPESGIAGEMAGRPVSAEAQVVKVADGIAYINHDLEDSLRYGMFGLNELPSSTRTILGERHSERINTLVTSVIRASTPLLSESVDGRQVVVLEPEVLAAADDLRHFLFDRVYWPINNLPPTQHAAQIVRDLFDYYLERPDLVPVPSGGVGRNESNARRVTDFIAGMTDRLARQRYEELFLPRPQEI